MKNCLLSTFGITILVGSLVPFGPNAGYAAPADNGPAEPVLSVR